MKQSRLLTAFLFAVVASQATFAQSEKLIGPDGRSEDYFGTAVAISGNTVVIGAPGDDPPAPFPILNIGGTYAYVSDGTQWTLQQYLLGSNLSGADGFGSSVAIDGDVIVVGAPQDNVGGIRRGSAFVIQRSGTSWFESAQLISSDGGTGLSESFGYSVAVSGNTIVVGAPLKNVGPNENQGAAYVFVRNGSTWTFQTKLTGSDSTAFDQFGRSVAISGNNIIVSAIFDDAPADRQGSAYIFSRQGANWIEKAKLTASDAASGDEFGDSVSISGNTAVVGAPWSDLPGVDAVGAAYVFSNNGSGWAERAKLSPSLPSAFSLFGTAVSIRSGLIVVGAELQDGTGSSHVFRRSGGRWNQAGQIPSFDITQNSDYGYSVGVSAGNVIIGARRDDILSRVDQGSAFTATNLPYGVSVDGRVVGPDGRGVQNTVVSISDSQNVVRHSLTNPFGYYRFPDLPARNNYTVSVRSKRSSYAPVNLNALVEDVTDLTFSPQ